MSTTGEKYFDLLLKTMVLNFAPREQLSASGDTFIVITRGGVLVASRGLRPDML